MKLKYNHNGQTESISLTKKKPEGKRLVVHHDDQNFYAPLADAGDATASKLKTVYMGEVYAVRKLPPPEIENILIAPPRVSVMQGQSATATVSAEGNEAVAGLSYSIAYNPTWITIADECILIQPSDNDQGEAIIEVRAKDIGSNASMSTAFVAEALLRPIITQLGIAPPAVTVGQGQSATALIEAEANSAVGGLSYSLDGAPSWIRNDNDTIWVEPTNNDVGTSTVNVVAYDTKSDARADTSFVATIKESPKFTGLTITPESVTLTPFDSSTVTLTVTKNSVATGAIRYYVKNSNAAITVTSPTASRYVTIQGVPDKFTKPSITAPLTIGASVTSGLASIDSILNVTVVPPKQSSNYYNYTAPRNGSGNETLNVSLYGGTPITLKGEKITGSTITAEKAPWGIVMHYVFNKSKIATAAQENAGNHTSAAISIYTAASKFYNSNIAVWRVAGLITTAPTWINTPITLNPT